MIPLLPILAALLIDPPADRTIQGTRSLFASSAFTSRLAFNGTTLVPNPSFQRTLTFDPRQWRKVEALRKTLEAHGHEIAWGRSPPRPTSAQVFEFLNAWFERAPEADWNLDGRIDSQDWYEYLRFFQTGNVQGTTTP